MRLTAKQLLHVGTMVAIGALELHRQPDIWENPEVYIIQCHYLLLEHVFLVY